MNFFYCLVAVDHRDRTFVKLTTIFFSLSMGLLSACVLQPLVSQPTDRSLDNSKQVPPQQMSVGKGLTWGTPKESPNDQIIRVSCHGFPRDTEAEENGTCNPYRGDTSCHVERPILCLRADGSPRPNYAVLGKAHAMPKEFYSGWAEGHIALTDPILGTELTSFETANDICSTEIGDGYRMASHGDGRWIVGMDEEHYYGSTWPESEQSRSGGWGFYAYGKISGQSRFWVYISDQPGNCWNSQRSE